MPTNPVTVAALIGSTPFHFHVAHPSGASGACERGRQLVFAIIDR